MPFTGKGSDVEMVRNRNTGRLDFDWDETGNPRYGDTNGHRVLSLLIEHRPRPATAQDAASPGWWADATGNRGSLLYTVKNVRRSTPSEAEAMAMDALRKAVDEGWIAEPSARAFLRPATSARLDVAWKNSGGRPGSVSLPLGS